MRRIVTFALVAAVAASVPAALAGVTGPKDPNTPKIRDFDDNTSSSRTNETPKGRAYPVTVHLAGGKTVNGSIRVEFDSFRVRHTADGFTWDKELRFDELAELRIVYWKAEKSKSSAEQLYYFLPARYVAVTADGSRIPLATRLKELDSFLLHSGYGTTRLFAYFADYWVGSEDDGYWKNAKKRQFDWNSTHPNQAVVWRIVFKRP